MSGLYVTPAEWTAWPTGLDTQDLVPGGTSGANAAELAAVVAAACQYVEQITTQALYARTVTDPGTQAWGGPGGRLQVRLSTFPALAISAAQWSAGPAGGWNAIAAANCQIYGALLQQYYVGGADYRAATSWGAPPVTVMTQYVAGYPNAVLSSSCASGATTLDVDDATGFSGGATIGGLALPGTVATIYDSANQAQETVAVSAVSGNTLTLAAGTAYAHAAGVRVSALPFAISEAAILLTSRELKAKREGGAVVMGQGALMSAKLPDDEDLLTARELLRPFIRRI